jgi:transketolase
VTAVQAWPRQVSDVLDHVWRHRSGLETRDAYVAMLLALGHADPGLMCLDTDMGGYEEHFAAELPRQYVNLGIAEANMVGVAAGLAAATGPVFANGMSPFLIGRAFEQIKIDIAGANLPVKLVGTHGGLSSGHFGPTHHALEDIGAARLLPNMTIVVPADAFQTAQATIALARTPGPAFLRLGRGATPPVGQDRAEFILGRASVLRPVGRVAFVATGPYPNLAAAEAVRRLARLDIQAGHLNVHTVKPLDRDALVEASMIAEVIVTIEDHRAAGGLGSAVCEVVAEAGGCPVRRIGVPDVHFDLVGGESYLLEQAGVTAANAVGTALDAIGADA